MYGLEPGLALTMRHWDRGSGHFTLELEGPTPAVLEIALAWGRFLHDTPPLTTEAALAHLESSRVPWR